MQVKKTALPDVLLMKPDLHPDSRGLFLESWQKSRYEQIGVPGCFVQDNISISSKGVLRGLHFQKTMPQGKLITLISGRIFDVAVDIRQDSVTFGHWIGTELNGENFEQLWIPPGFAHGFLVLSDQAVFNYKCTDYYHPGDEGTIAWNDPALNINWPLDGKFPVLSAKDASAPSFREIFG